MHPQPLNHWPRKYHHKLATAEEALAIIKSGYRVYIGGGCGEPVALAHRMTNPLTLLGHFRAIVRWFVREHGGY